MTGTDLAILAGFGLAGFVALIVWMNIATRGQEADEEDRWW